MVEHGASVYSSDPEWSNAGVITTALTEAAENGHLDVVQYLVDLDHVTNVDAQIDARGIRVNQTALLVAAKNGHLDVVQYLVDHGANVDVRDAESGKTAPMLAAENGHLDIVNFFKELEDK